MDKFEELTDKLNITMEALTAEITRQNWNRLRSNIDLNAYLAALKAGEDVHLADFDRTKGIVKSTTSDELKKAKRG